jgi:hypothetical protein
LPRVASYFADDVLWEAPDTLPAGGVIRGRDAALEQQGGTMGKQTGVMLYVLALVTVVVGVDVCSSGIGSWSA